MKILRAIGAFFARIGRWIKDTAWVQPLLIVGGIFAIIFSIKPISDAFSNMFKGGVASEDYYNAFRLSLENAEKGESEADKLFSAIEKMEGDNYPSKFYVAFVSKNCANCDACYPGFKTFQENFNQGAFKINDGYVGDGFKLYTIFCDERNSKDELLIDDFLKNHADYFEQLFGVVNENIDSESYDYYNNTTDKATFKANVASFYNCINADEEEDNVSLPTPTTLLIDRTDAGMANMIYKSCTEVFFNFTIDASGDDAFSKGYFLRDSWNYKGKFCDERQA